MTTSARERIEALALDGATVRELEELSDALVALIALRRQERAQELREEIGKKAEREGLRLDEVLAPGKRRSSASRSTPRYQNPADASQTWSGRGRRPAWVTQLLEEGARLEDLRLESHHQLTNLD